MSAWGKAWSNAWGKAWGLNEALPSRPKRYIVRVESRVIRTIQMESKL